MLCGVADHDDDDIYDDWHDAERENPWETPDSVQRVARVSLASRQ